MTNDEFEDVKQLLATAARVAERNTQAIDRLTDNQRFMQQDIQLVLHRLELMQSNIQATQSDIRGLQTENRLILQRLEAHFANGHGGES